MKKEYLPIPAECYLGYTSSNPLVQVPSYATPSSAGADLYAATSDFIQPGKTSVIHTGISVEIPTGFFGAVFARSGLATKNGIRPANCVGIIDSDYRGEIMIPLHNDGSEPVLISDGQRIAQLIIIPYVKVHFQKVTALSDTKRNDGGFGSTGK